MNTTTSTIRANAQLPDFETLGHDNGNVFASSRLPQAAVESRQYPSLNSSAESFHPSPMHSQLCFPPTSVSYPM